MRVIGLDVHCTLAEVAFFQEGVLQSGADGRLPRPVWPRLASTDEVGLEAAVLFDRCVPRCQNRDREPASVTRERARARCTGSARLDPGLGRRHLASFGLSRMGQPLLLPPSTFSVSPSSCSPFAALRRPGGALGAQLRMGKKWIRRRLRPLYVPALPLAIWKSSRVHGLRQAAGSLSAIITDSCLSGGRCTGARTRIQVTHCYCACVRARVRRMQSLRSRSLT
jgi:hypothetical protein